MPISKLICLGEQLSKFYFLYPPVTTTVEAQPAKHHRRQFLRHKARWPRHSHLVCLGEQWLVLVVWYCLVYLYYTLFSKVFLYLFLYKYNQIFLGFFQKNHGSTTTYVAGGTWINDFPYTKLRQYKPSIATLSFIYMSLRYRPIKNTILS